MSTLPPPGTPIPSGDPGSPRSSATSSTSVERRPGRAAPRPAQLAALVVALAAIVGLLVWAPWSSDDPPSTAGACTAAQDKAASLTEAQASFSKLGADAKLSDFQNGLRKMLETGQSMIDDSVDAVKTVDRRVSAEVAAQIDAFLKDAETIKTSTNGVLDKVRSAKSATEIIAVVQDPSLKGANTLNLTDPKFAALNAELAKTPECAAMISAIAALG